jgi:hypothetical protein
MYSKTSFCCRLIFKIYFRNSVSGNPASTFKQYLLYCDLTHKQFTYTQVDVTVNVKPILCSQPFPCGKIRIKTPFPRGKIRINTLWHTKSYIISKLYMHSCMTTFTLFFLLHYFTFTALYISIYIFKPLSCTTQFMDLQVTSCSFSIQPSSDLFIINCHKKELIPADGIEISFLYTLHHKNIC